MVFQKKTNAVKNKASEMPQRAIKKNVLKFEDDDDDEDDDIDEEDDEDIDDSDEAGDVNDSDEEEEEEDDDDDSDEEEEDSDSEPETNKMHKKVGISKGIQKSEKKQMLDLSQKRNSQPLKKDTLQHKLKMNTSQIQPPKKDTSQIQPPKKDTSQMKTPKNAQGLSPANDKKPVKNSTMLQQQKQKTPKKEAGPNKFVDSKNPKKRMVEESNNWEMQRKKERDSRNLYVRNLPADVTVEEIKSLSPDILGVSIPQKSYKKSRARFAFLEFSNEEKAEENYVFLQKKVIRSCEIFVDYVGEKSKNLKVTDPLQGKTINKTKLYASGLPIEANMEDIAKLFPNAFTIYLSSYPEHRACVASFHDEAAAEEAYKSCANAKVKGRSITVLYSLEKPTKNKRKRKQRSNQNSPQKRMKQEQQVKQKQEQQVEQESDDDDDDDDEDDE